MKSLLAILSLLILTGSSGLAQSLQVEKSVGQPLQIAWDYTAAQEIEIDSFVVEHCTGNNTGCADLSTKLKTERAHTLTVTATSRPFYQVRSVKGTSRSTPSNPVAITIKIPPPLGAWGQ